MTPTKGLLWLGLFIRILTTSGAVPAEYKETTDPQASMTIPELKDHMFFLASDELRGRKTASREFRIAADYCVSQLRAAGLKPLVPDRQGNPSFLQRIPPVHKVIQPKNVLCFKNPGGETCFSHGDQCLVATVQYPEETRAPVTSPVFVGYGISSPDTGWDDYRDLDVEGRIVICLHGAPRLHGKPMLPPQEDKVYSDLEKGGALKLQAAEKHRAAGLIYVLDPPPSQAWDEIKAMKMFTHDVLHYPGREPHPPRKIIPVILLHASAARIVFETYSYDPFENLAAANENGLRRFLMDKTALTVQLEYLHEDVECHNVTAIIPGTDDAVGDQYNESSVHIPIDFTRPEEDTERFFKIGDHFSFYKNGIPVVFFEDGGTSDLHKTTDDPEKIDFAKLQKVSQLVYPLVIELGNTDDNLRGQPGK